MSGDRDEAPTLVQETSSGRRKQRRLYVTLKEAHESVKESRPPRRLGGDVAKVVGDRLVPRVEHIHFRDNDGVLGNHGSVS